MIILSCFFNHVMSIFGAVYPTQAHSKPVDYPMVQEGDFGEGTITNYRQFSGANEPKSHDFDWRRNLPRPVEKM